MSASLPAAPPSALEPQVSGRAMLAVGWVAIVVVVAVTFTGGLPVSAEPKAVTLAMTALATMLWLLILRGTKLGARVLVAGLLVVGMLGAGLDLTSPRGSGYLLVFMALTTMGLRLPRRTAVIAGVPVILSAGWAQAATSPRPVSAALNIAVGAGFLVFTSAFAATNRDAHAKAASLLVQQAETRQAREEAAVLAERTRLARELHDVLAHTLSGLAVQLEGARLLAEHTHAEARLVAQVAKAQTLVRDGIAGAGRAVATLRGDALPGPENLPALARQAARSTGRPVTYAVVGAARALAPEVGLALYRTAQEALTNTAKYAGSAARAAVTLTWTAGAVSIEVVDCGGGRPSVEHHSGGLGLAGLAERAALAGGHLETGPYDQGWRVSLTLPDATDLLASEHVETEPAR